ncbi:hypothetical protein QVD17_36246 [Tagetes erecta]|uniref:RING-type domain-containing protein n=1 Tax=Tagetes erecta TaxID=13708 RepID=A0AAD8JSC2_TARER|nr:hypothetical protein QVD17_36246 [Tagetes erecta]
MDTTGEPIDTDDNNKGYVLGVYFSLLFIIFILCYISYICKRNTLSSSPDSTGLDYHYITLPEGLPDHVLETFPTFLYSQTGTPDTERDQGANGYNSGCSICLAEYKQEDLVRLLPKCGHLFHVSCVDTWLKVRPSCPVCRNSLDFNVN